MADGQWSQRPIFSVSFLHNMSRILGWRLSLGLRLKTDDVDPVEVSLGSF